MEPFIIDIQPSVSKDFILSAHEGEEFIYVLSGEIEINYGKAVYHLQEGDSIFYDSIVEHHVHAHKEKGAKILACTDYKPQLADDDDKNSWQNFGDCEFRIPFKNKLYSLDMDEVKTLMRGENVEKDEFTIKLNVENKFFTDIEFKNKEKFEI